MLLAIHIGQRDRDSVWREEREENSKQCFCNINCFIFFNNFFAPLVLHDFFPPVYEGEIKVA